MRHCRPVREGSQQPPWVLVAAGFHRNGGMDKANLALAEFLVEQGTRVHLVSHDVDPEFAQHPLVEVHAVPRPGGSYFLGQPLMDIYARRVARRVTTNYPGARVVVNGENCLWPDINWIHYVHAAWEAPPPQGPPWFRLKENWMNRRVRRRELQAARLAQIFITNSHRTTRDMVDLLGAAHGYQANVAAISAIKDMINHSIDLMK